MTQSKARKAAPAAPAPPSTPPYKQITLRVPWTVWLQLTATAAVLDEAQGAVVTQALQCFLRCRPATTQKLIEGMVALRQGDTP